MTHETKYILDRGGHDLEITVEYTVAPLIPAVGPSWNDPGAPAEGGEIESLTAYLDGEKLPLTDEEERQIEAWIYERHDYSADDGDYWEE